ncbi:MAG: hypothetical protein AAFQ82_06365 [Myxococcota bacterium]
MPKQQMIAELVERVLDGTGLELAVDTYRLEENLDGGRVTMSCDVHDAKTGEKTSIHGSGVGLIDAVFAGLLDRYSGSYPSLNSIRFSDFSIKANVETGDHDARSDMAAKCELEILNSDGRSFHFQHASPSITASSIYVVLGAVEFFVNSERAFIAVYRALQHAKRENRHDSVQAYTAQLSTLVEATSYSEVIEQVKRDEAQ